VKLGSASKRLVILSGFKFSGLREHFLSNVRTLHCGKILSYGVKPEPPSLQEFTQEIIALVIFGLPNITKADGAVHRPVACEKSVRYDCRLAGLADS